MADLVRKRQHRAEKIAWFLQAVPFIRFIGLTGSLAYDVAKSNSDIDIFIIARKGRIWTVRYLVILILKILRMYRSGDSYKERAGKICPNRFVADDYLLINPQNRYHAQDYTQMIPLYDSRVYKKFIKHNSWMAKYGYYVPNKALSLIQCGNVLGTIRKSGEWILGSAIGDWLEKYLRKKQIKFLSKNPLFNKEGSGIYADDKEIRIHPRPR